MALRPPCRMGPPLRSSAADAHYCIMVQIPRIYRIQVCGAMLRAQLASAPQIVPNSETQHHTREQSELPRLTLDGKIPIQEWAHRSGALPPMRITASWSRSLGSTEYKYVARCSAPSWRAPLRSSQTPSGDMPKHARRDLGLD